MYCRDLLESVGYGATVTKAAGDEGVDVELRSKDGQTGPAQCKHGVNLRVGRPTLRQLYGEMLSRRATFGHLMTTGTFTCSCPA
jgi:restriction system protein